MDWSKFHFICRQVSPLLDIESNNRSVESIVTEVEQAPLTSLYGKAKSSKKDITYRLLNHLKTLQSNSVTKDIFNIYGAIDLSENNKSQKHIRSIVSYPIFVSIVYILFASMFSIYIFPEWKMFIDIDSLDKFRYLTVQGNNTLIVVILILLVTSFFLTYSLYAIRLLKIMIKPDASILKLFFNKGVRESYANIHTLIHFPLELNNNNKDSLSNEPSNHILKQYLEVLIHKGGDYSREYKDLCIQQEAALSSSLMSSINMIKVILFILVTAAIAGLVIGVYGIIILFGGTIL